jgi:hypothetical protein
MTPPSTAARLALLASEAGARDPDIRLFRIARVAQASPFRVTSSGSVSGVRAGTGAMVIGDRVPSDARFAGTLRKKLVADG